MFFHTTQFLSLLDFNNIAGSYWHLYPAQVCQAVYIFIYLPNFPFLLHLAYKSFKWPIGFCHWHDPQNIFYIMFELFCFGCSLKAKEEECDWLFSNLILVPLTHFACLFILRSPTLLPICYLYIFLSVLLLPKCLFCGWISWHFLPHL